MILKTDSTDRLTDRFINHERTDLDDSKLKRRSNECCRMVELCWNQHDCSTPV